MSFTAIKGFFQKLFTPKETDIEKAQRKAGEMAELKKWVNLHNPGAWDSPASRLEYELGLESAARNINRNRP